MFLTLLIAFSTLVSLNTSFAEPNIWNIVATGDATMGVTRDGYIESFKAGLWGFFFEGDVTGEKGAKYLMVTIARDVKNVVTLLAIVFLFIMVIKIMFSDGSEEDVKKWRWGIISASLGIVLMQVAYAGVSLLFGQKVTGVTAFNFLEKIIYPFVHMLELLASFAFLAMAFYSFFLIVTAWWADDKAKKGKQTILFAIIGFMLIKVPRILVESIYGKATCSTGFLGMWVCQITTPNLSATVQIMTTLINYFNGFIGIITVILIIYAGFLVLTGGWDDEKLKKAKSIIAYAIIGIFLLVVSYILFNFFVLKG
jgi:hypothetical protein